MLGKIALEEHFATEETIDQASQAVPAAHWPDLRDRLADLHEGRLRQMDENGIELAILSLITPGVQGIADTALAIDIARRANDFLAEQVAKRPHRFQGFAALPMQDPDEAARELERCVRDLGFRGAMVNGFSETGSTSAMLYYDLEQYWPVWATVQDLGVPFYLHPRNPLPEQAKIYDGHPWLLGPTWAFGQETAVHALRLMGSGLFDRYPALQIVLGHLGEGLPFSLWRIDNRLAWLKEPPQHKGQQKIAHYAQKNLHLTTSGQLHTPSLVQAMLEIGSDRILFSTDWPFENMNHAADWFDSADISEFDRAKIGRRNAIRLFKLEDLLGGDG
ncbi:MAG: amidohydrolase family protein [Pseudomonadota bacterium]